nr:linker for activation of T-cells family member 1 isoform X1 [Macaca nemestrina]
MAPPGLSRVRGFQGRSLFFEASTMSGVLLSTWFCVLRHSRPLATCLPACHLLPTPEPARPAPHPVSSCSALIPPNSTLHPLTFLDWGPLSLLQLLWPPESHLRHDPSPLTPRRSPQPLGGSHRTPSSRRDSDGANSVASYENEEPACEDADEDEDEDDYHNPGYLVVLPDSTPAASTAAPSATALSTPGLRDSAFSMESIDDYVNVPESGESAEASLDGSREYVNVSQELHPGAAKTEPAALSSQKAEEVEEEGAPDYENLQELN